MNSNSDISSTPDPWLEGGDTSNNQQAEETDIVSLMGQWSMPSFSTLLRYMGGLFVIASAVIYLLQGLVDANMSIRYWVYLGLMLVLAVGGVFSFKYMRDDKGARLFFGLATLLVPVQFTQLGAMIYDFFNPAGASGEIVSFTELSLFSGLSLLLGGLATLGGLAILVRPHAKQLTLNFLVFNALLLLPIRELMPTVVIASVLTGIIYLLDKQTFQTDHRFSLFEGNAAKAIMISPLVIILARAGFHFSHDLGIGIMIMEAALIIQYFNTLTQAHMGKLTKAFSLISYLLGSFAWCWIADELFFSIGAIFRVASDLESFIIAVPLLLLSAKIDMQSMNTTIYRIFACIIYLLLAITVWFNESMFSLVLLSALSIGVILYAIKQESIALIGCAGIGLIASLFSLLSLSVIQIDMNAWLGLAIAGVLLVTASSVLERYGKPVKDKFTDSVTGLKEWRF